MKKIILILLLFLLTNVSHAKTDLPFVGKKFFNFLGGSGTGYSITIKKNGMTIIELHGTQNSQILYKGSFKNPIILKNGSGWFLKDNKIYQVQQGQVRENCDSDNPCAADLYD